MSVTTLLDVPEGVTTLVLSLKAQIAVMVEASSPFKRDELQDALVQELAEFLSQGNVPPDEAVKAYQLTEEHAKAWFE